MYPRKKRHERIYNLSNIPQLMFGFAIFVHILRVFVFIFTVGFRCFCFYVLSFFLLIATKRKETKHLTYRSAFRPNACQICINHNNLLVELYEKNKKATIYSINQLFPNVYQIDRFFIHLYHLCKQFSRNSAPYYILESVCTKERSDHLRLRIAMSHIFQHLRMDCCSKKCRCGNNSSFQLFEFLI